MKEELILLANICLDNPEFYGVDKNRIEVYNRNICTFFLTLTTTPLIPLGEIDREQYEDVRRSYYDPINVNSYEYMSELVISFEKKPPLIIDIKADCEILEEVVSTHKVDWVKEVKKWYTNKFSYQKIKDVDLNVVKKSYQYKFNIKSGSLSFELTKEEYDALLLKFNTNKASFAKTNDENIVRERIKKFQK